MGEQNQLLPGAMRPAIGSRPPETTSLRSGGSPRFQPPNPGIKETPMFIILIPRILAWMLTAAIIILTLAAPRLRPETALPHVIEHAGIFLITGCAFAIGYPKRGPILLIGSTL